MGLFSGLEKFNIGGLDNIMEKGVFGEEKERESKLPEQKKEPVEKDYLFMKEYTCPICDSKTKLPSMRGGKAKFSGADMDLRPKYEHIEPIKYDVVCCPFCGYTALTRFFPKTTSYERKFVKELIAPNFKPASFIGSETYTDEEALSLYRLGLACSVVKKAHASEKAYMALKAGWLIRSMIEKTDDEKRASELKETEKEFLSSAQEGFLIARESETYPIVGMDEYTLDYLISAISYEIGDINISAKMTSDLLTSPKTPTRVKNKAIELKELIQKEIKKAQK